MFSYQHAFHAGCHADVLKHTLWAMLLQAMTEKPKPLNIYETHSGRGLYPVDAPEMQKIAEYKTGLARLFPAHAYSSSNPYVLAVTAVNPPHKLAMVPGSPAMAAHLRRDGDHVHLAEAHPLEFSHLERNFGGRDGMHLHRADGHVHIPALMKAGQRDVVLIDPSYEVKTEYMQVVETVTTMLRRNPQAVIMVWYPVLEKKLYQKLIDGLKALDVQATWLAQCHWAKPEREGMTGAGHIILNLPFTTPRLDESMAAALRSLMPLIKDDANHVTTTFLQPRR